MTHAFDHLLMKKYHGKPVQEVLDASPAALKGVSDGDAQHLMDAFGITTLRDLAMNKYVHRAQTILATAGDPDFDPGPPPAWSQFFASAPLDYYVQHPAARFRLDFGPVYYRGRLDGTSRLIVVGQDPAANELLGHRIFVGHSGQRVQGFLNKLGVTRSYTMLNTFLFSILGQIDQEMRSISLEEPILTYRNAFLDRLADENIIQAIIAIGNGAQHAVSNWPGSQHYPVFNIMHPAAPNEAALIESWNASLPGLLDVVDPDDDGTPDPAPYGSTFVAEDSTPIPCLDLPFGLPDWHGDGTHGTRDGNKRIIWIAP